MAHAPSHQRRRKRRFAPPGSSPGQIVIDPESPKPELHAFAYGPSQCKDVPKTDSATAAALVGTAPVVWIDVEGLGDAEVLRDLGTRFGMHRLAVEDVAASHQRSKVDRYDNGLFIVIRAPVPSENGFDTEQISFFVGENFLLTFQEGRPGDCFTGVRDRINRAIGRIRSSGPDYLAYALIDAVVDAYFPTLERLGERVDALEQQALASPTPETTIEIRSLRRDLLSARRAIWPLREAIHSLVRDHSGNLEPETVVHIRDCYDHCIELLDLIEMYRDLASGLMDIHLSSLNNRLNEVMRVLTIVSTIFIPMSFVSGVYGMNFEYMPETKWKYGYAFALVLMGAIGGGLLFWFWKNGWMRSTFPKGEQEREEQASRG
jgi:magnesium transporter